MNTRNESQNLQLFGLPAEQGRWFLILLGILILLCLGTVYSWSVFRKPLETLLNVGATESLLPYTFVLIVHSVFVSVTGFYLDRMGTRRVIIIGGTLVGIGYVFSSFATNISILIFTYGVLVGIGSGMVYGVPMVIAARWFPDQKGLAVGLTIIGFGLSPIMTAPLAEVLIDSYGVKQTLLVLGIAFTVIILSIALMFKVPPKGWIPKKWQIIPTNDRVREKRHRSNLLQTRSFYGLWVCYIIGTLVGLSAIGISSPVATEIIKLDSTLAATSISLFALFNGLSRPLFGWLTDRAKPRYVAVVSYVLILIATILMMNAQEGQVINYLIAFCIFWFCLGGWVALAPTATLVLFSSENYAHNYGIVYTAYGVGALLGTLITGRIRDLSGSYIYAFYPMAFLAVIGIVVALATLKHDRTR